MRPSQLITLRLVARRGRCWLDRSTDLPVRATTCGQTGPRVRVATLRLHQCGSEPRSLPGSSVLCEGLPAFVEPVEQDGLEAVRSLKGEDGDVGVEARARTVVGQLIAVRPSGSRGRRHRWARSEQVPGRHGSQPMRSGARRRGSWMKCSCNASETSASQPGSAVDGSTPTRFHSPGRIFTPAHTMSIPATWFGIRRCAAVMEKAGSNASAMTAWSSPNHGSSMIGRPPSRTLVDSATLPLRRVAALRWAVTAATHGGPGGGDPGVRRRTETVRRYGARM